MVRFGEINSQNSEGEFLVEIDLELLNNGHKDIML